MTLPRFPFALSITRNQCPEKCASKDYCVQVIRFLIVQLPRKATYCPSHLVFCIIRLALCSPTAWLAIQSCSFTRRCKIVRTNRSLALQAVASWGYRPNAVFSDRSRAEQRLCGSSCELTHTKKNHFGTKAELRDMSRASKVFTRWLLSSAFVFPRVSSFLQMYALCI